MVIKKDADLLQAARELIVAIHRAGTPQLRHRLLQQIASLLSDENFPALIKLFLIVGESDDAFAKKSLAEALADTLLRGDIPSASLTTWGSAAVGLTVQARGFSAGSRLDPLQYLCAWYCQSTDRTAGAATSSTLSAGTFSRAVEALLSVFVDHSEAAQRYREKIRIDLQNSQEGALTETTRKLLGQIVDDWQQGVAARMIAEKASGMRRSSATNMVDLARAQLFGLHIQPANKNRP
jgi:hypothetical protein